MKVSIIVPVYNVERTLDRCVSSIVNQTYRDLQIILVDDGSPDDSPRMCDEWQRKDARIEVIHKPNGGLSDARNAGLERADGDYIAFVDSDDYVEPDYISTMLSAAENNHADLVICSIVEENADGTQANSNGVIVANTEVCDAHECFRRSADWHLITAWNKLYARKLWQRTSFPKGKIHEDEYVFHDIVGQCSTIVMLPNRLYHYVENTAGITSSGFGVKTLVTLEALSRRIRFFASNGYEDCIKGAFKSLFTVVCRAAVLMRENPGVEECVFNALQYVRNLPLGMLRYLTVKQQIRLLQIKVYPHFLMKTLGKRYNKQFKNSFDGRN